MPTCRQCSAPFVLAAPEQGFRVRLGVPPPFLCPNCRRQRRLRFRNFFNLYHRSCDLTGKKILSMYDVDAVFPVYETHDWWSDKWDALTYGKNVDFSRPFLEQVAELHRCVPRMSIVTSQCENTDYCNMSFKSRNCYLVFGCVDNEDCSYGHIVWQSRDCYDCLYVYRSAYCYECVDCVQCHALSFSRDCDNCSDSFLLVHCVGCRNCFGCVGLRNKEHHIFNVPHSKEEYEKKIAELKTGSHQTIELAKKQVQKLIGKEIVKHYHGFGCEDVTGDYLYNCKDVREGYDLKNCENVRYCATLESFRDSQDCNFCPAASELCYECVAVDGYQLLASHNCSQQCANLSYCDHCFSSKDCFGCAGLKQKRYCILNKQYSKEDYEALVPKIIAHMKAAGEYGEFFSGEMSPFGYDESIANTYFPLTEEEAKKRAWKWKGEEQKAQQYLGPDVILPDDIRNTDDAVCNQILRCSASGKPYKIIPQEFRFLRERNLPLPRKSFIERQKDRFALRNPRHLWSRECEKCKKPIETSYPPERPEIIYCESCYLATVY